MPSHEVLKKDYQASPKSFDKLLRDIGEIENCEKQQRLFFQSVTVACLAFFMGYWMNQNLQLDSSSNSVQDPPEFVASQGSVVEKPIDDQKIRFLWVVADVREPKESF